jgi:hypothetical protein
VCVIHGSNKFVIKIIFALMCDFLEGCDVCALRPMRHICKIFCDTTLPTHKLAPPCCLVWVVRAAQAKFKISGYSVFTSLPMKSRSF